LSIFVLGERFTRKCSTSNNGSYRYLQQVLTPAAKGMAGAVAKAEAILAGLGPDGYVLQQFNNADNPKVRRRARECSHVDITRGAGTKCRGGRIRAHITNNIVFNVDFPIRSQFYRQYCERPLPCPAGT
jgi:hypothetical protein